MRLPLLVLTTTIIGSVLLTGCGSDDSSEGATGQVTEITAAPTTTVVDPYAIPATIDTAYVDKVLAVLQSRRDDAVNAVSRDKQFTAETETVLKAIYAGDALSGQVGVFSRAASVVQPDAAATARGQVVTTRIVVARTDCVWIEAVSSGVGGSVEVGMVLQPIAHDLSINPTPWVWTKDTARAELTSANAC